MRGRRERSKEVFAQGLRFLPGGVDSPVRSFQGVGGDPVVMASGAGSRIQDVDGNEYIDYCGSWGPLVLGHAHEAVVEAVTDTAGRGLTLGTATEAEVRLAGLVCAAVPTLEMVRFVSSGTEATMTALRLARGYTGRDKVLKFEGCYHGHSDGLLVQAGSGLATLSLPGSAGVPEGYAAETLLAPFNNIEAVDALFRERGEEIAAVIVEPVAANMGVVLPAPGFLEALRVLCSDAGSLLIFDEVVTGFRVGRGGYQQLSGVAPDLTCLGKVIGGGMPVGALGGRREVMQELAPLGPVYQAGTLSGNPLAMAAGLATLEAVSAEGFFEALEERTDSLVDGIRKLVGRIEVAAQVNQCGSMFTIFFSDSPVIDYASARKADTRSYARFFHALLDESVYFPPSQFETAFVSAAHTEADIDATLHAVEAALSSLLKFD
jgi:glutamate-1-semialdehyde 2,1-aminomutase